jgi:hypothetical protein
MNNPLLPPPRIASFLLKKLVLPEIRSGAMEDFTEQFNWIYQNRGRWLAVIWYWT